MPSYKRSFLALVTMFAVRGWKVQESALQTQTTDAQAQHTYARESAEAHSSQKSKRSRKRKRDGSTDDAAEEVTTGNLPDLWQTHIEKKIAKESPSKDDEEADEPANFKKQKKSAKQKHLNLVESAKQPIDFANHNAEKTPKNERRAQQHAALAKASAPKEPTKHSKTKHEPKEQATGLIVEPGVVEPKLTKLQSSMRQKLISSRFRHLNETLYTKPSSASSNLFKENPEFFQEYHQGFRQQVEAWPENPLEGFLTWIRRRGGDPGHSSKKNWKHKKQNAKTKGAKPATDTDPDVEPLPRNFRTGICMIVDLGCGEGQLAASLLNAPPTPPLAKRMKLAVRSFDLASTAAHVTACDIRSLPMADDTIDIAIFCLALMGTNWIEFIEEAYRVLRWKGECWISEVGSRFSTLNSNQPVEHSVGSRRKAKMNAREEKDGRKEQMPLTVEEDTPLQQPTTDVSAFVDVLRRRGFQLAGEPEMGNKMFVRMRFIKALPPSKGKGVLFKGGGAMGGKPAFIEVERKEISDEAEAHVLKPCVYKLR